MPEIDETATHSEEVTQESTIPQVDEKKAVSDAFDMFGLTPSKETNSEESEAPPTEQKTEEAPKKGITVKFNKEETFIEEDKIPEYARKGLNYDKVEARVKESQDALDRSAKLLGFKDHAELTANLDKLEQQQQQKSQDEFERLKSDLKQEFIDSGLDPERVDAYIENHPLMQKARETVQKDEERSVRETLAKTQEQTQKAWQELYKEFPDLVESSQSFNDGKDPEWYNADMKARLNKGYDPVDAYRLAHMSTIQTQTKKAAEQKAIKDVMLGKRSQVETTQTTDTEPHVPEALSSAFSIFGLNPKNAKKYVK
jgi:hypothetical protein